MFGFILAWLRLNEERHVRHVFWQNPPNVLWKKEYIVKSGCAFFLEWVNLNIELKKKYWAYK
jgi:hypothetical protein